MPPRPAQAPKKGISKKKLMASMVNIPSTNPDPYYRYKMPALELRYNPARIRTNNPQKEPIEVPASTVIQNLPAVAKALNRPLEYLSKFLELELGTDFTAGLDDRQKIFKIQGGEIPQAELMKLVDKFIRRFVLCALCKNPETALTIFNTHIMRECGACGMASKIDRFSKLARYILRNRQFGMGFAPVVVDSSKCRFLKEGVSTAQGGKTAMGNTNGFRNGVKVATAEEMAEDEDDDHSDEDDDQDWVFDSSQEAVQARREAEQDLIDRIEKIMNSGLGNKGKDPYLLFRDYVTTPLDDDKGGALPDKEEVLGKFYALDLEKEGAIVVLEKLYERQCKGEQEQTGCGVGNDDNDDSDADSETEIETRARAGAEAGADEESGAGTCANAPLSDASVMRRSRTDYPEMIQLLKDSLEREVVVASVAEDDEDDDSEDDSDDDEDHDSDEE
ncbi:hypothetical protein BGZ73_005964 [Actinomortierella ambigua]|nr:hypothetical protein BGZ73_005964 [Actinomortierella ambigua]